MSFTYTISDKTDKIVNSFTCALNRCNILMSTNRGDNRKLGHARRLIRKLSMKDAEEIASRALKARTPEEALRCSSAYLEQHMPELLAAVREG